MTAAVIRGQSDSNRQAGNAAVKIIRIRGKAAAAIIEPRDM